MLQPDSENILIAWRNGPRMKARMKARIGVEGYNIHKPQGVVHSLAAAPSWIEAWSLCYEVLHSPRRSSPSSGRDTNLIVVGHSFKYPCKDTIFNFFGNMLLT